MNRFLLVLALLFSAIAHAAPAANDELLEPEQAFRLTTRVVDADTVEAQWKIAQGTYLYRNKLKFEPLDDGVMVKEAQLPPGIKKHDEFFGDVETYRGDVTALLHLTRNRADAQPLKLKITSQGCADLGVCYPPQVHVVDLKLPAQANAAPKSGVPGTQSNNKLGVLADLIEPNANSDFLEPDQAFKLSLVGTDPNTVHARIDIAPGYYLYRDKISFQGAGAALGNYTLPAGQVKVDEFFGKTAILHDRVDVDLPVTGKAGTVDIVAKYQGCAEKGICYPPVTKKVSVTLPTRASAGSATTESNVGPAGMIGAAETKLVAKTSGQTFILAVLGAFGAGLLLTFTPCVLPMVPILSSVLVGTGDRKLSKVEGALISYAYVFGTAVTYMIAGAIAGATGEQLQAYFQTPWAIGAFAGILGLLALSMFGFYELQMPGFVQSYLHHHTQRIHHHSHKVPGGVYAGVFVMGMLSALIVGACVSPVLISALGAAISAKDPALGAGIMFALAHGQGAILIALGVGAGYLLPKAGHWMNQVKHVFGVLLLAVAVHLLTALPQVPVLLLWAALLIITAVYLGATQSLTKDAGGWAYLLKGTGTFMLVWGVFALLGGFAGSRDILQPLPLSRLAEPRAASTSAETAQFQRVQSASELDAQLAAAKSAGKPSLVDFYATWCTDCVRMEKTTFTDARVQQALARFALIQADVSENSDTSRAIKQRLGVLGPPAMVVFGADGNERPELRTYGYKTVNEFLALLGRV